MGVLQLVHEGSASRAAALIVLHFVRGAHLLLTILRPLILKVDIPLYPWVLASLVLAVDAVLAQGGAGLHRMHAHNALSALQ